MALQPCVGLCLVHGNLWLWRFSNRNIFLGGVVSPTVNPQTGGHFLWPLPFYLSGMGGSTRSLRSRQHSSLGHWGAQTSLFAIKRYTSRRHICIVKCRGGYRRGFELVIWIYWHYTFTQLGPTGNTAVSLIYTHYSSPLHTHYCSQSSLVVSW
jgi:hypothetical protein